MELADIFDILIFSVLTYGAVMLLKRTRSLFVVYGIIIVSAVYGASRVFGFRLTEAALSLFFNIFLLGLIIIFQAEIRRYFEMVAAFLAPRAAGFSLKAKTGDSDRVARVAARCAKEKTGILVVFAGRETLGRHLSGGFYLGGAVSEPILESIFDASSPGHDGAVIVEDGRIARFGVHLPLSQDFGQIEAYGTRHSAAPGIAEASDALAVVVSEEKGTIAIAHEGKIRKMKGEADLRAAIEAFIRGRHGKPKSMRFSGLIESLPEKILAVLLAAIAWAALIVPGFR